MIEYAAWIAALVPLVLIARWVSWFRFRRSVLRRLDGLETKLESLRGAATGPGRAEAQAPPPSEPATSPSAAAATSPGPEPSIEDAQPSAPEPPPVALPSPPAPPASRIPAALSRIDWEQWIGVRGAAVLGGVVLALAGLLFVRYSIERDLISPTLRVAIGTLVGLASVAASQSKLRRSYPDAVQALTGAGLVLLYASFWGAGVLYELIPAGFAFFLMTLVTAAGCLLSFQERSLLVASLGLLGGFATPYLLSSGADRPIGLFGYLLLLDVAFLVVAVKRRWPWLAAASLGGTLLYQAGWISLRMDAERALLGLGVLALFGLVFAFARPRDESRLEGPWWMTTAGAILFPIALTVHFASRAELSPSPVPLAALLLLLSGAASWIARNERIGWISLAASSGGVAVFWTWLASRDGGDLPGWQISLSAVALVALFHGFVEADRDRSKLDGPAPAAFVAAGGLFTLLLIAALTARDPSPWPWVLGWTLIGALGLRHGELPGRRDLSAIAGAALGFAFAVTVLVRGPDSGFPAIALYLAAIVLVAAVIQARMHMRSEPERETELGAVLFPITVNVCLAGAFATDLVTDLYLPASVGFGVLGALAATVSGSGRWYLASVIGTAVPHATWTFSNVMDGDIAAASLSLALILQIGSVLLFTAWPFTVVDRFRRDGWAWVGAALAAPLWFLPLLALYTDRFGEDWIAVLPLGLAAVSVVALSRVLGLWETSDPRRTSAVAWLGAVALGFVSVAIPLQLERHWVTIGWALEGAAVLFLWTRVDHVGLKVFGLALLGFVVFRLAEPSSVARGANAWPIVNWQLYTYWIPIAALLSAASLLESREVPRLREWERERLYPRVLPIGAAAAGLAAIALVFLWLNLAIDDWFSSGTATALARGAARELTRSVTWAVYALGLLGVALARESTGLRWVSLGVLVLTIGKVFLYDLGELEDLFRVLSLLGLAISLILVSLGYQRFVFGRTKGGDT